MNAVLTCPDAETLRQYLLGTLAPGDTDDWAGHFSTCFVCSRRIDALRQHDPLLTYHHQSSSIHKLAAEPSAASAPTDTFGGPTPVRTLIQEGGVVPELSANGQAGLAPPQSADELGRLGKYRILKVLGTGGMGTVYLAEDTELRRRLAVKTMKPAIARYDEARQRFLREARATASFQHDHIVPIYEVGEANGIPYLTMPVLTGETLDVFLQKAPGRLPPAEIARIGQEIAAGLAAAHQHGLIHRDIKPANIWLEASARVKILDFGLARSLHEHSQLTRSGMIVGTPSYMSPEQARGRDIDPRSDLFSLGVVLYRLCAGRLPFEGPSVMAILSALAIEEPSSLRAFNPSIPVELADLIEQLLRKKPGDRPASAQMVSDRLMEIHSRLLAGSDAPTREQVIAAPPRSLWQRFGLPVAAGILVAILAIVLALVGRGKPVPQPVSEPPQPQPATNHQPPEFVAVLGDHLQQQGVTIQEIEVAPDGRWVASYAAHDRHVRVWSAGDRRLLAELETGGAAVHALAFSRDSHWLAVALGTELKLFVLQESEVRSRGSFKFPAAVSTIRFSPDSRLVAVADVRSELVLWDLDKAMETHRWHFAGPVQSLAITSDGRYLATGHANGTTQLLLLPRNPR